MQVIADTCKTMGNGMADFLEKDGIKTKADYDLYCYYVSGFVGVTLTKVRPRSPLQGRAVILQE